MVTRTLVYERPTKRYVRFLDVERGTVHYIANEDFEALGRPDHIEHTLAPAAAGAELRAA